MRVDVGIIGGTGTGEVLFEREGAPIEVPTPVGALSGKLIQSGSRQVVLVQRHSAGHKVPPHRVNYKAIALGLQSLGVKFCFSTAAVGSLRTDWPAGTLVACSDFIDVSGRNLTLFEDTVVHRDFTEPFGVETRKALLASASSVGQVIQEQGVYVCANGPRYETPHEVKAYRQLGGDIVGMTAASEAVLMREAYIDYGCLAIVTNLAAGLSPVELSHLEVVAEMKHVGGRALALLERAVALLPVEG